MNLPLTPCNFYFLQKPNDNKPWRSGYDADFSSAEFERRKGLTLLCKTVLAFQKIIKDFKNLIRPSDTFSLRRRKRISPLIYQHFLIPRHNFLFLNLKRQERIWII